MSEIKSQNPVPPEPTPLAARRSQDGNVNVGGGRGVPDGWSLLRGLEVPSAARKLGVPYNAAVTFEAYGVDRRTRKQEFREHPAGFLVPTRDADRVATLTHEFERNGANSRSKSALELLQTAAVSAPLEGWTDERKATLAALIASVAKR
jgi:hypothetical protein